MPQLQLPKPEITPTAQREVIIKNTILDGLGTPDDLWKVIVKRLWDDNFYRVNVYRTIKKLPSITDSFFVHYIEVNAQRHTIECSPPIAFKYYDAELGKLFAREPNSLVKISEADDTPQLRKVA